MTSFGAALQRLRSSAIGRQVHNQGYEAGIGLLGVAPAVMTAVVGEAAGQAVCPPLTASSRRECLLFGGPNRSSRPKAVSSGREQIARKPTLDSSHCPWLRRKSHSLGARCAWSQVLIVSCEGCVCAWRQRGARTGPPVSQDKPVSSRVRSGSISIAVHELPSLGLQLLQFCLIERIPPHGEAEQMRGTSHRYVVQLEPPE